MLNISNHSADKERSECPLRNFVERTNSNTSNKILRKFINSAIYIEKPLDVNLSSENCSISQKNSAEDFLGPKTKRCTCSLDQKTCPCHFKHNVAPVQADEKAHPVNSVILSKMAENTSKISQNFENAHNNINQKNHVIKKWIDKEREEKKKKEIESKKTLEVKMAAKKMLLEQERNNFRKWLMNKKKLEMEAKKKKEKELEEKQIQELEKEKRQLENQLNFQLWLKRKEEELLEKKIKQQIDVIGELERREKQLKDNEKAFSDWLKNSKNKQKPVPLNKGLQSLRSATSVTYVNPTPWNPTA